MKKLKAPHPLIRVDENDQIHFAPFGSRTYLINHDQAQRAASFIDNYLIWGALSVALIQYFLGYQWTSSFLVFYFGFYFVRMQMLVRLATESDLSINLEEISRILVEEQTISAIAVANILGLCFLFWGVYSVSLAWPLPIDLLFSSFITLFLSLIYFSYSTFLLYLKGQYLQNFKD